MVHQLFEWFLTTKEATTCTKPIAIPWLCWLWQASFTLCFRSFLWLYFCSSASCTTTKPLKQGDYGSVSKSYQWPLSSIIMLIPAQALILQAALYYKVHKDPLVYTTRPIRIVISRRVIVELGGVRSNLFNGISVFSLTDNDSLPTD